MNKVTVHQGQSLFDVALQAYGSIEGVFGLAGTISDSVEPGTELNISGAVINKYVIDEYLSTGIIPATGLAAAQATGDGIGYWIIENDFIVQ